jgi:hypothetical protein
MMIVLAALNSSYVPLAATPQKVAQDDTVVREVSARCHCPSVETLSRAEGGTSDLHENQQRELERCKAAGGANAGYVQEAELERAYSR